MGSAPARAWRGDEEQLTSTVVMDIPIPPEGTAERWAYDYVTSEELGHKLAPPPVPAGWEEAAPVRRIERPGRPSSLQIVKRAHKSPGPDAIRDPARRAQLVHTFLHHELQAAELMAWALLAFPEAPRAFKVGLLRIAGDEIRHMAMYAQYMEGLGHAFGEFPVRDWFWERVPRSKSPAHFAAVMGMGLEGGNLDHTARFAGRFRAIGDEEGARIQEIVCAEEVPHVRFGLRWFQRFTEGLDFEAWRAHLPEPLSPMVMRGSPLNREDRIRAGFPEDFLQELDKWAPESRGS
ncbi:ferritin-like domain-containing protein [Polyangium fumosum]|uniref:DUF455 family protein n=1 Tax=Polyangium fumosum TaxID=889272 RepID=A0A4U1J933_9BACT|nr:DUF455 family protein [Polyangium fumosum]TKD04465.1 DUF455 family protein [Polyangium fumosum]